MGTVQVFIRLFERIRLEWLNQMELLDGQQYLNVTMILVFFGPVRHKKT